MQTDNRAPYTHGMEIEQFADELPAEVRNYTMNNSEGVTDGWHLDGSGPRETAIGPTKNVKSILDTFFADTVDQGITWDWHSADSRGRGAGSHVHLCMARDVFDDEVAAWTITYNTCVELFPLLAPYFCHDWEQGFREGSGAVSRWASPTIQRLSQNSVADFVERPRSFRRSYDAVTFNEQRGEKPVTIELRANDAHPSMALNGLMLLRRVCGRAVEAGWSPKLVNHDTKLRHLYDVIYSRASRVGLMEAMQEPVPGGIRFEEGRGIPGVKQTEFETPFQVLRAIQRAYPQTPGTWTAYGEALVANGVDEEGPQNNVEGLWNIDSPVDEFEWPRGPDVDPAADVDPVDPDADLEDMEFVGAGRAEALREGGFETPADLQGADPEDVAHLVNGVGKNVARKLVAQVEGVDFGADGGEHWLETGSLDIATQVI